MNLLGIANKIHSMKGKGKGKEKPILRYSARNMNQKAGTYLGASRRRRHARVIRLSLARPHQNRSSK